MLLLKKLIWQESKLNILLYVCHNWSKFYLRNGPSLLRIRWTKLRKESDIICTDRTVDVSQIFHRWSKPAVNSKSFFQNVCLKWRTLRKCNFLSSVSRYYTSQWKRLNLKGTSLHATSLSSFTFFFISWTCTSWNL